MIEQFPGFQPDSFRFFRELSKNNNKLWFDANRHRYEQSVVRPFRSALALLSPMLLDLNPSFEVRGKTNENFSRINRDIRFRQDKSPYKLNYYLYVYDRNLKRQKDGRLYMGLSEECVTVGFSIYADDRSSCKLERIMKPRIEESLDLLLDYWRKCSLGRKYQTYWHAMEKKEWIKVDGLPKKLSDWQRLLAWIVRKRFEPDHRKLATPAFLSEVARIFHELYPLYVFSSYERPDWRKEMNRAEEKGS